MDIIETPLCSPVIFVSRQYSLTFNPDHDYACFIFEGVIDVAEFWILQSRRVHRVDLILTTNLDL